ncbi:MAG: NTP transferase domain-containing protein [Labilithrix sp.]|nr:NTP transferase domain-containing protein [Labilithrix sp.]
MIDKAIILAAGVGRRIGGMANAAPKPLLPLDDSARLTFLDWHLRSLAHHGAREIYLVGNAVTFGTKTTAMEKIPATWVLNDFPGEVSGSGHSTHLAFTSPHGILDGKSRVVLMDADVVYDPSLFAELASSPSKKSKTLVCGRFRETDEEVMVFGDAAGVPRLHGKGLLGTPMVKELRCLGEATGILLLEPGDHDAWLRTSAWCMKFSTAKTRSEHEDITQRMLTTGALDAVVFDDDARCMECDTPDEYEVVRREMVPRWLPKLP